MADLDIHFSPLRVNIKHKKFIGYNGEQTTILRDIEFQVRNTEVVMITGPSGCGKTTLLNLVANLDRDYCGNITLPPFDKDSLPLSYVFQESRLLPWRTVRENITLVLQNPQQQDNVDWLLERMKLQHAVDQYPATLSLGMCRRVALARAFAVNAPLLLMDEPFSSIDELTAMQLRKLLQSQLEIAPRKVLFVTHNLREALLLGNRLLIVAQRPATLVADLPLFTEEKRTSDAIESLHKEILQKFPDVLG